MPNAAGKPNQLAVSVLDMKNKKEKEEVFLFPLAERGSWHLFPECPGKGNLSVCLFFSPLL